MTVIFSQTYTISRLTYMIAQLFTVYAGNAIQKINVPVVRGYL